MIKKSTRQLLVAGCLLLPAGVTHAYSTFLTITNNQNWQPQPQNFAEVTIDAIDVGGGDFDYKFTVDLCADLTSDACAVGQDIEQFGFNIVGSLTWDSSNFSLPNAGWDVDFAPPPQTLDGFGGFDVVAFNNSAGEQPLMFTITGVIGDSIATYATDGSSGGQPNAGSIFAAKVSAGAQGAFIGGGTAVPIPAAVWLLGSGLIGLVGVARRKRSS